MPTASLPRISELSLSGTNNYEFKFVGEGAANVVFKVIEQSDGGNRNRNFQGNLLRVPKAGTKAHGYVELQEYWETVVAPLFSPEDLVQQILVKLGDEAIISRLNEALGKEEDNRRPDFRGSRIALAEHAMLVEDMRPNHPDDLCLEFKPKWLAQSPNAPASATRCRNCARKAHQRHTKHGKADKLTILCPLSFLTSTARPSSLPAILDHLSAPNPPLTPRAPTPEQRARLAHWVQTNTLLPRIRAVQLANDRGGPLAANAHDLQFQLAMTLRDCTCFVRIPADPSAPVEAKLADLDKKNWEAKLGYWQTIERCLIEDGYYEEREQPRQETDCQLGALKDGIRIGDGVE
ncbi:Inositol-pentakisphosphate 2-kinase [Madurella fahalii]|uniref:Inositol-pentakisphosphate 2-kinase n=1 Tax=Madurella fahalii TaxID=1157608 RepID=A0ABQ0GRT4_9PEZI